MKFKHQAIVFQLAKREIQQRYKSSYLGFIWTVINPLLMLVIYSVVFSVIFKYKWGASTAGGTKLDFALTLFCGLIVFNIFGETVGRASGLIVSNPNLVKRVVFPLAVLPMSVLLASLFQAAISLFILLVFVGFADHVIHLTILYVPLVLLPLLFITLGLSWFLSSLGVFVRDVGQTVNIVIQMLFYLTPIFYPISVVPTSFRGYMLINPLTAVVDDMRDIILNGRPPQFWTMAYVYLVGVVIMGLGYIWFAKTRKGFADVV